MLRRALPSHVVVAVALLAGCSLGGCQTTEGEARPLPGDSASAQSTGAGPSGSGSGGGGGGEPSVDPSCSQWTGPFGDAQDEVLDPNLSWSGFAPGKVEATEVELADYVTCGGADEVTAVVLYIDALWCAVCRDAASDLADRYEQEWKDKGIRVVSMLVEDSDGNPASLESAWVWRNSYGLEDTPVVIDPAYALADEHPDALPKVLVIDPRTMRIVARAIGNVDISPVLAQLVDAANE